MLSIYNAPFCHGLGLRFNSYPPCSQIGMGRF